MKRLLLVVLIDRDKIEIEIRLEILIDRDKSRVIERGPRGASTTEQDHEGLAGGFANACAPPAGADE